MENVAATVVANLISAALLALIAWLVVIATDVVAPAMAALIRALVRTALITLVCALGSIPLSILYFRYVRVLGGGGQPEGSPPRQAYDSLRESVSGGGLLAFNTARQLTAFLDAVDRFFGDAGTADRTLFPHAFGLLTRAPLWTAPAFERCLQLALIYPIATILVIWAISGHVGPAEVALGLKSDLSDWQRQAVVIAIGLSAFAFWRSTQTKRWKSLAWLVFTFPAIFVGAAAANSVGAVALTVALTFAGAFSFTAAIAVAGAFAIVLAIAVLYNISSAGVLACAASVGAAIVVARLNNLAVHYRRQGIFFSFFVPAAIFLSLATIPLLAQLKSWEISGPLLLFFVFLTLIKAPFDWLSLGMTRALIRRGLELGGWWPLFLALWNAVMAAVTVINLALVTVVVVQVFDELAVRGGGESILPLDALFDDLTVHPAAPEFWWLYVLLLSPMIPSLVNLVIGAAPLLRGVPGLSSVLLQFIPSARAVPDFDRPWIALVLTLQIAVGAMVGMLAQLFLAVGIIFYVMPWFGIGLLDMARNVVLFDLPARTWQLFHYVL